MIIFLAFLHVWLMAWIVKDARRRSVEGGVFWMFGALLFGLLVLIIYLWSRPPGVLERCHRCSQLRLPYVRICPHCGHLTEG